MEHKHTPGHWTQDKFGNVKTPFGNTLVTEGVALAGSSNEETRANARLISAAPELLEALQEIIASADAGNAAILDSLTCKARAAIAKATGAQQ